MTKSQWLNKWLGGVILATSFLGINAPYAVALPEAVVVEKAQSPQLESFIYASQQELDAIYHQASAGKMPHGSSDGRAAFFPGSVTNVPIAMLARIIWQGKILDRDRGIVLNRVFGMNLVKAQLYRGKSLYDGKESIIIDYSRTSIFFRRIRDEIREISPGFYLGRAYLRTVLGPVMAVNFALDFN